MDTGTAMDIAQHLIHQDSGKTSSTTAGCLLYTHSYYRSVCSCIDCCSTTKPEDAKQ